MPCLKIGVSLVSAAFEAGVNGLIPELKAGSETEAGKITPRTICLYHERIYGADDRLGSTSPLSLQTGAHLHISILSFSFTIRTFTLH